MTHRTLVLTRASFYRLLLFTCFLVVATTAGNCDPSETIFRSNFDSTDFDQPPTTTQSIGTADIDGDPGGVLVAAAPPNASPPAKWLKISRPDNNAQLPAFIGRFSKTPIDGTYVFSGNLVVPDGNVGPVTIQFENPTGQGFFHLDFMPNGTVRIDDDASTTFGSFNRNQVFLVQVKFTSSGTAPSTAHVLLTGAGASGEADRTIIPAFQNFSRQFGAVRLFIGFPNVGTFHATTIAVTRKT